MRPSFLWTALVLVGAQDGGQVLPLKVGSAWEYAGKKYGKPAEVKWEITKAEKKSGHDCVLLEMTEGKEKTYGLWVRPTAEGIRIEDAGQKQISDEERFLLKFPLDPGSKASTFFSAPEPAVVEEKTEEVKVPAGTFTCIVLRHESAIPGLGKRTSRDWFCKGTGFVKFETVHVRDNGETSTETMELARYSPGK